MEFRNVVDDVYAAHQQRVVLAITLIFTVNLFLLIFFRVIPLAGLHYLWLLSPLFIALATYGLMQLINRQYKFVFKQQYLDAGTMLTKMMIPYEDIVDVVRTIDFKDGNSMMTAQRGLKLVLKNGYWDHLKVSPANEKAFLVQLKQKAPHLNI